MKPTNFIVRIPEPCHEDWNSMQPDAKGKFCNSCNKSVFDFSNKTDSEIKDILKEHQNQKVCGHFKKSQVDRPLNINVSLNDLPKNMSITKAFAIALFLVFGTFLFSCTDNKGQKVGEIEVVNIAKENYGVLGGITMSHPSQEVVEELVTGDIAAPEEETVVISEDYVEGGVNFVEPSITEEIPVTVKEEAQVDNVIVGMMVMDYREVNDSTISPNDSTNQAEQRKINTDVIHHSESGLSIYPNPSNGKFSIKYDLSQRSDVRLNIFDVNGSLVKEVVNINSQYEGKYKIPVDLSDLPNGIYIINLINNGKRTTERIVIER